MGADRDQSTSKNSSPRQDMMKGTSGEDRKDRPNKIKANEEDLEEDKEESPKRRHLLPPSAQEESPTGASAYQDLSRNNEGPIRAYKENKPNKSTADEEDSEGD